MAVWNYKNRLSRRDAAAECGRFARKVQWMEEHFYQLAFKGQEYTYDDEGFKIPIRITDPHTGPVRQYYSWLVRLTQQKDVARRRARVLGREEASGDPVAVFFRNCGARVYQALTVKRFGRATPRWA